MEDTKEPKETGGTRDTEETGLVDPADSAQSHGEEGEEGEEGASVHELEKEEEDDREDDVEDDEAESGHEVDELDELYEMDEMEELYEELFEEEEEPQHPVFDLVFQGNIEAVRQLLSTDRTLVHRRDHHDHSPIHYPAKGRSESTAKLEMARLLLSQGALVNSRASEFYTPLHIACMMGREKMCELLLTNGARYDLKLEHGRYSPLDEAREVKVVKALIR